MNPYEKAIQHYGETVQLEKTLEELNELRLEVRRALDGDWDLKALITEIADVYNVIESLKIIFDISQCEIEAEQQMKMNRTMLRIEKERES